MKSKKIVAKQRQVLQLLKDGRTAKEIAALMQLRLQYIYNLKSMDKKKRAQSRSLSPATNKPVMVQPNDVQVGGDHYKSLNIQPWDAMQAWLTPEEFRGFLKGNVIKYLARKKDAKDPLKAQHYLAKLNSLDA